LKKKTKPANLAGAQPALLDSLRDLLMICETSGKLVYVNNTACRALGYARQELLAKNIKQIVAPQYSALLAGRIRRLRKEGELLTTTAYRKRRGGTLTAEARYNVSAIGGRPCVICLARPMPGERNVSAELGEVRERYRRLVEGLKGEYFFYQHGADGVFTYLSPSVRNVLGYGPEDFLKHYTRYLTDDPANREVVRHTARSLKGVQQPPYRLQVFHKNGSRRWLEVLEMPVKDAHGRTAMVEGIAHDITERVKAHDELEKYRAGLEDLVGEQTAELKAVFDRIPVLMVLLDEALNVIRTNARPGSGRLIGDVLKCANAGGGNCGRGRRCADCQIRKAIVGTLRTGRPVSRAEARLLAADGRKTFFLLSTAIIRTASGKQLLLCLDDITRMKEAEESLRKSEEFRRLILSSVGDGIIGVDIRGRILFMNESAQTMLGWTLEELAGKNLHSVIHYARPDGSAYPLSECPMYASYTGEKESVVQDEMLWRRDGKGFYVRYSSRPMYNKGEVSGAVITFNDVTLKRRAEMELLANKERLQVQNDALTELGRGPSARPGGADAAFLEAAETAAPAVDADRVSVWLFSEDRAALVCRACWDRASRTPSSGLRLERAAYPAYFRRLERERYLVVDDARSDFRVSEFRETFIKPGNIGSVLEIVINNGGKAAGVIRAERSGPPRPWQLDERNMLAAVADFAALALASSEKAKLEEMKDFLTHTIVHDLKNPLASIIAAGEMLEEGAMRRLSAAQREMLVILNAQAQEMKRLVSNILDINRIEEGKLPVKAESFRPEKLLREAADSLRIAAAHDKKKIKVRLSGTPGPVRGDYELLLRVMENLIVNALKFSPDGAEVDVGARPAPAGGVEFYVKDSGPGIPAGQHARIFEKFVQLDDPAAKKWGGRAWGWRSANWWSRRMAAASGWNPRPASAAFSFFQCRRPPRPERSWYNRYVGDTELCAADILKH